MANDDKAEATLPPPVSPQPDGEALPTKANPPAWAKGLRDLYDSVVEEPLPDSFLDLLSQLDQEPE